MPFIFGRDDEVKRAKIRARLANLELKAAKARSKLGRYGPDPDEDPSGWTDRSDRRRAGRDDGRSEE